MYQENNKIRGEKRGSGGKRFSQLPDSRSLGFQKKHWISKNWINSKKMAKPTTGHLQDVDCLVVNTRAGHDC